MTHYNTHHYTNSVANGCKRLQTENLALTLRLLETIYLKEKVQPVTTSFRGLQPQNVPLNTLNAQGCKVAVVAVKNVTPKIIEKQSGVSIHNINSYVSKFKI